MRETQLTDVDIGARLRDAQDPAFDVPVATALVDPDWTLNGQVLVAAGGCTPWQPWNGARSRFRRAGSPRPTRRPGQHQQGGQTGGVPGRHGGVLDFTAGLETFDPQEGQ